MNRKPRLPTRQYVRDMKWIELHIDQLARKHPNEWIAVRKGRVVAIGQKLAPIKSSMSRRFGDEEIPVYFVDDGTIVLAN